MNKTGKKTTNSIVSVLVLIGSILGISFLIRKTAPSLISSIVKIQKENLLATEPEIETYRPPQPFSLPTPQLENLTNGCPGNTLKVTGQAKTISQKTLANCAVDLKMTATFESSLIQNSIINIRAPNVAFNKCIIINTQINIEPHSSVFILNSEIKKSSKNIHFTSAKVWVEKSTFTNNQHPQLFYAKGHSELTVNESIFEENQGVIFSTHNLETSIPLLSINKNIFKNNAQNIIKLENLDRFGTRIADNIFTGNHTHYIAINDSQNANIFIAQNYFTGKGIEILNSDKVTIWKNKFSNIEDCAVSVTDSNYIAFQANIFSSVQPAAIFSQNTPRIELVKNKLENTEQEVTSNE